MSMATGLPYVGSPLENLTLSDPKCNNDSCKAFYEGHMESQRRTSYYHQYDYGHYVTWFYLTTVGCLTVIFFWRRWNESRFSKGASQLEPYPRRLVQQTVAGWRYFAYRRYPGWMSNSFGLPSFGILAFMTLVVLYGLLLTFWKRPYYRAHRGYGSPPLAVRTGLMAVALTPLMVALSGKANLVTLLTGIGHEKLNVFHRWVGWICFFLSVAHTIPFIVAPLKDGGYKRLHQQYYHKGGFEYTGTPPLAILFGILVLSIPWIRHRAYEAFYHVHFWMAVTYFGLMFWHCGQEGDSWAYLWATLAIWLASIATRAFYFTQPTSMKASRWLTGSPLTPKPFPDNVTRLEIVPPAGFHWSPGQHVYIRIPKLNVFDNHPFTIATADKHPGDDHTRQLIQLYVRSHAGFTRRLRHHLQSAPDTQLEAWLEGPYGGHHRDLSATFDHIVLVAGGGGISAVLPWLDFLVEKSRTRQRLCTRSVRLYWSVRHRQAVSWIAEDLERLQLDALRPAFQVFLHVTRDDEAAAPADADVQAEKVVAAAETHSSDGKSDASKESESASEPKAQAESLGLAVHSGRINLRGICDHFSPGASGVVVGCGPESLKVDLSNAVAAVQARVLRGELGEVSLWTETFGW